MIFLILDHALKTTLLAAFLLALRKLFSSFLTGRQRLLLWLPLLVRAIWPFSFLPRLPWGLPSLPDLAQPAKPLFLIILAVYLAGMLFMVSRFFLVNKRLHKALLGQARPVQLDAIPLPVFVTELIPSACLFTAGKKQLIYIHPDLLADQEKSHHILMHEWSHARQKDPLWHRLRILVLIIHWYNPLLWYAASRLVLDSECACDQHTVASLGQQHKARYAHTLFSLVKTSGSKSPVRLSRVSSAWTSRQELKVRLLALSRPDKPTGKSIFFGWICLLLLLATLLTFTGRLTLPGNLNPALPVLAEKVPQMTQFP